MYWDTACPDWEQRILAGQPLVPELPLFRQEAEKALRVFKRLRIPDVIGTPRLAEASGEWFFAVVAALFGAYDPIQNRRMIQEVFLLVPKKNAKSTGAAAVMVTAAIVNRRPEAEFLLIAPTKEIADISFRQASGMIRADEELTKLFHLQRHIRTITHRKSGAFIQIKASDTDTITGVKATGILVDETHVFAAKSGAADVFVEIRGALAARPDGFMFQITTQSKTPPAGVFKAELAKARDVRDGKKKLPLLPVLYELPAAVAKDDGWKSPQNLGLVNPNLGRSVNLEFLTRELQTAEDAGIEALTLFASQHLNVEIGLRLLADAWPGAAHWEKNAEPGLTLEALLARCEVATIGIDGGGLDDLLGLVVIGRELAIAAPAPPSEAAPAGPGEDPRRWLLWAHAWCHRSVLELRKDIAPRLRDFERDRDLTIVDRVGDDVIQVADIVERIHAAGLLPEKKAVGVDPAGIGEIVEELGNRSIDATPEAGVIVGIPQGWKLTGAIKTTERKLAGGTLRHGGSALMAWCVGNAKVEPRGNAISITKQAAGKAKIDPLMAAFDAAALMAMNPSAGDGSYLDQEDLLVL